MSVIAFMYVIKTPEFGGFLPELNVDGFQKFMGNNRVMEVISIEVLWDENIPSLFYIWDGRKNGQTIYTYIVKFCLIFYKEFWYSVLLLRISRKLRSYS